MALRVVGTKVLRFIIKTGESGSHWHTFEFPGSDAHLAFRVIGISFKLSVSRLSSLDNGRFDDVA